MDEGVLSRAKALEARILEIQSMASNPRGWSISYAGKVLYDGSNGGYIDKLHAKVLTACRRAATEIYERELAKLRAEFRDL